MSPLLEALQAAAKVGFDAPECTGCEGFAALRLLSCGKCATAGWPHGGSCRSDTFVDYPCVCCDATGLDASVPYELIGRAHAWFFLKAIDVTSKWATDEVIAFRDVPVSVLPFGTATHEWTERHDGTTDGLATALLRLVARSGAQEPRKESAP